MHDTQTETTNIFELCADSQNFKTKQFSKEGDMSLEIDFDAIKLDTELININKKGSNTLDFLGDMEESTEIESIVSPLNSTITSSKHSAGEENTETDEILAILKQKSPRENKEFGGNPQLDVARKVSMTGRVIRAEPGLEHRCSLPIRPRCIPQRVSNPFYKNFDSLSCKINNKNYINVENISHSEQ
jgi:hypothetical protein